MRVVRRIVAHAELEQQRVACCDVCQQHALSPCDLHGAQLGCGLASEQRSWAVDLEAYVGSYAAGPLWQRATDR